MTLFPLFLRVVATVTWLCIHGYNGEENPPIHHLVLLENLPSEFNHTSNPEIVIRTNYSGLVHFKESDDFKVLLNITAPTIDKAYGVHSQMVADKGRLLIQVYEEPSVARPISLGWIFLLVGVATCIVASLAILYAVWWYCSKKYIDIEQDKFSHGNVMYRARNSMHLSAAQAEEIMLSRGDDDHDTFPNDDPLRGVPELPEQEEAEAMEMEELQATEKHGIDGDSDNDYEKRVAKKRLQAQARKIHKDYYKRDIARRKRHPSLNDPPSYDAVMEYPNESSDDSDDANDHDTSNRRLLPTIEGSDTSLGDRTYQNVYRDGAITTFRTLDTHIPVAHSDGDLTLANLASRRGRHLPRLAKGMVTPPVAMSEELTRGPSFPKTDSIGMGRDSKETVVNREDSNASPFRVTAVVHQTTPQSPEHAGSRPGSTTGSRPTSVTGSRPGSGKGSRPGSSTSSRVGSNSQLRPAYATISQAHPVSTMDSGIYTLEKNPMDIPLTSFKRGPPPPIPVKPPVVPTHRSTPVSGTRSPQATEAQDLYQYGKLENSGNPYPPSLMTSDNLMSPGGHRFSLMSEKTFSLYGSSEIFDANQQQRDKDFDENDSESDIEVEIPPLGDSDADILSDASLPLPSPPAFIRPQGSNYTFDGSPISPAARKFLYGDSLHGISAMSPGFDDWDDMRGGRLIAATASPTNTLDKHFVFPPPQQSQDSGMSDGPDMATFNDNNGLSTPPPPLPPPNPVQRSISDIQGNHINLQAPPTKAYHSPHRYSTSREEGRSPHHLHPDGREYAEQNGHRERQRQLSGGKQGRGRGGKPLMGPKVLHLTILSTFCILSVLGGVYAKMSEPETEVYMTVYAPRNFLAAHRINVFFNQDKKADIEASPFDVQPYVASDPILWRMNSTLCTRNQCAQGCDENTGRCICKKGYKLDKDGICKDVNECHEMTFRCHKDAGCLNSKGSYDCRCSYPFFGDGKYCEECTKGCPKNMWEVQGCTNKQPKICRACTKVCVDGFYLLSPCQSNNDISCRMCHQKCAQGRYEYKQCTRRQNRECRERSELHEPSTSANVVFENQLEVADEEAKMPYTQSDLSEVRRLSFQRGSGFYIKMAIKHLNPMFVFEPVDHGDNNDLRSFPGKQMITRQYCPYPVPAHYELFYLKHQNQKYRTYMTKTGTVIEPCDTYMRHGSYPDLSHRDSGSILCSEPGPVSSVYAIQREFGTSKDTWVEKSVDCHHGNEACLNCTLRCTRQMMKDQGQCSVRESDGDGGSPRLPTCFACCIQQNCTDLCRNYHDRGCQTVRCQEGNLIEFRLRPVYNNGEDYLCHVSPVTNQNLIELEYTIMHFHKELYRSNISLYGNDEWMTTGKTHHRDQIVNIEIDSKLGKMPNFIQGTPSTGTMKVGVYKEAGSKVKHAHITGSSALARPVWPFKVTSSIFGSKSCEDEALDDLVLATGSEDPYDPITDLHGKYLGNMSYLITNFTTHPRVRIAVDKHVSLLSVLYPSTELIFSHLHGNITHNSSHWLVEVYGAIKTCPGFLKLNISDADYSSDPLFQYELGIKCPKTFNISFSVPNGDKPYFEKDFIVTVKDRITTYHLNIYKPRSKVTQVPTKGKTRGQLLSLSSTEDVTPPHFSIPFIASVCGGTLLLIFIATFGICVKFNQPRSDVLRFHWCHLVLMVGYIVFQFVFAVLASMTVFVLIIMAVNSDTTAFLQNYQQQRSVKSAYSHLELDHMERHLMTEIARQNQLANTSKAMCEQQMHKITDDFAKLKRDMESEVKTRMEQENLNNLLADHTQQLLQSFTNSLAIFSYRYNNYLKYTRQVFTSDIRDTYDSVEKNKWLSGANFLRRKVKILRDMMNLPTKPFIDWMGLKNDLIHTTTDSQIPTPDLPRFSMADTVMGGNSDPSPRIQTTINTEKTLESHNYWIYNNKPQGYNKPLYEQNTTETQNDGHQISESTYNGYYVFFGVMLFIDLIWFLHRMLKALGVSQLLLFGYPIYLDIRDKTARSRHPSESEAYMKKRKKWFKQGFFHTMKEFFFKILSSMFIPKVIAAVLVCLIMYVLSVATLHFVNRETFSYLGYYNNIDDLLEMNEAFINNRIKTHAMRINMMEYPTYQELVNLHIQRHHYVYKMVERQWQVLGDTHAQLYCQYLQQLDVKAQCNKPLSMRFSDLQISACHFQQVEPELYEGHSGPESTVAEIQMDAFLKSIRQMISDTSYIVLIYLSVIIVKELLGTVLWLYMKRSGFMNLRIIYEADEPPPPASRTT
ncbi:uncharacterized protein [Argopecten irradians]|uniref:uncharacterized protein n=1 Tax=Argopecten irradians TaxID=31199 RepID=UPI00371DA099